MSALTEIHNVRAELEKAKERIKQLEEERIPADLIDAVVMKVTEGQTTEAYQNWREITKDHNSENGNLFLLLKEFAEK